MHREAQQIGRLQPGVGHVVAVAHPGHHLALDGAAVLDEGEDVGQDLAGVELVGQAVDDGHARVLGKALDLVLPKVRIITRSVMRLMTRALSSIGSARPSWLSPVVRCTTEPPSWYMPASKLTRVRVLAFSKIMASVRSLSVWCFS
jgi:hypothetical protein